MLKEVAITPGIFDSEAFESEEIWLEQLRELGVGLFPKTAVSPAVISDLFDGSLFPHLKERVIAIECEHVRRYAEGLLQRLSGALVNRPQKREWPGDEDGSWCEEAVASHRDENLYRVVTTRQTVERNGSEGELVFPVEVCSLDAFWEGFSATASPRMFVTEQVRLVRSMTLHCDWIAVINPHALGSEREFVRSLYANACKRADGFYTPSFEIHAESNGEKTDPHERQRQERVATSIRNDLFERHPIVAPLRVLFWPKFLDRFVAAGSFKSPNRTETRRKLRWAVSMNHVARSNEESDERTNWHLIDKPALRHLEEQFFSSKREQLASVIEFDRSGKRKM